MPAGPIEWLPQRELLSYEEIARVTRILVRMGVEKVRLTGGEPMARRDIDRLVALLHGIEGLHSIGMTTNGYYLEGRAETLRRSGLSSLNVSLDSLRRERFFELTRRDHFGRVMAGIEAARAAGFPIRINAVVMRGKNDDEVPDFAAWASEKGYTVRFIEFMPLDSDKIWNRSLVVTADEMLERLRQIGEVEPAGNDPSDPARQYRVRLAPGKEATIGIIPSVSRPFCRHCDRIRLTAEGRIRNCLFAHEEHDLKAMLRGGASDEAIAEAVRRAVWAKWEGHLIDRPGFRRPERPMYAIGG